MYDFIKDIKYDVYDFVKNHDHIRYCECIIYPDGMISKVKPSHLYTLLRIAGGEEIYKQMPIISSPLHWLVEYTGCISVWYEMCLLPSSITKEQEETINTLAFNKIIENNPNVVRLIEEEVNSINKALEENKK